MKNKKAKRENVKVTELELNVLQHIWDAENGLPVTTIVEDWKEKKEPGYTTILKTLQNLEKRGLVSHRREGRKYFYLAEIEKEVVTRNRLGRLIDGMFAGNKLSFVEYFVKSNDLSSDELKQIKALINQKEKGA